MKAAEVRASRIVVRAQIDLEGENVPSLGDEFYVVYPDNRRTTAKIIEVNGKGTTIMVGGDKGQSFRIRLATPSDFPVSTGSNLHTAWIVTESL